MNYHIFPQDKFFHSYIEDIYKLHQEKNNVFWVRGNSGESMYFHTDRHVVYLGNNKEIIIEHLKKLSPKDRLFVAWYDLFIGECILRSGISNDLYVYLMGGDFYDDPPGYNDHWLYDYHTRKIIKKIHIPQINIKRKPKNWHKTIKEIHERLNYKKNINNSFNLKTKTIKRIDFIITSPDNWSEINTVKNIFPCFHGEYVYGAFDLNYDLTKEITGTYTLNGNEPLNILLGNSSDPSNNHIDACDFLQNKIFVNKRIICPLSYGDSPPYSQLFQKWAQKHLQNQFFPITTFLGRKDYINLINRMDIVVMYHNRQQAFGNIITSLSLGKPVFLKPNNPIYTMLKAMGVPNIYDINKIGNLNIKEICESAAKKREQCIVAIKKYYSEQARLEYLVNLLK